MDMDAPPPPRMQKASFESDASSFLKCGSVHALDTFYGRFFERRKSAQ
jgi:hypothetical protein